MKHYHRLVEVFVKPQTRDEIRKAKGVMTYDQFLNLLLNETKEKTN